MNNNTIILLILSIVLICTCVIIYTYRIRETFEAPSNFVQLWFNYIKFARAYMINSIHDPNSISSNYNKLTPFKLDLNSNQYNIAKAIDQIYPHTMENVWPILDNHIKIFIEIVDKHVDHPLHEPVPTIIPIFLENWKTNTDTFVSLLHDMNSKYEISRLQKLLSQITSGLYTDLNMILNGVQDDEIYNYNLNLASTFASYLISTK